VKLLLLLLLGQQQVNIIPVDLAAIRQPDGGIVQVVGGTWFSEAEVIAMGKDHADLRKQNEHYEAHVADVPYKWILATAGVSITLGIILGATGARALPR